MVTVYFLIAALLVTLVAYITVDRWLLVLWCFVWHHRWFDMPEYSLCLRCGKKVRLHT